MKIVLALDSFKESLTSIEAADAFARGFKRILPKTNFIKTSISDGGEGFAASFLFNRGGRIIRSTACDPLGRTIQCGFGLFDHNEKAVIETAVASGLMLLSSRERNPLKTTTFGTGRLIDAALGKGVREIIVGLGGSATNDGGAGMAQALGVKFYDHNGEIFKTPLSGKDLIRIGRIDPGPLPARLKSVAIFAACDVDNPMTGKNGASAVYGPQKGATPAMVKSLDAGMRSYCRIVKRDLGMDIEYRPGAGAAGGLGGGLMAFMGAELKPGIDLMLSAGRFDDLLSHADLVVTGEGQIDGQSVRNKAPVGVARAARKRGVPVIALCGRKGKGFTLTYAEGVSSVFSIVHGPCGLKEALQSGKENMENTGENLARLIRSLKL